ncbi:SgcJ/EcaC family oxidoreductase [Streptomyces atratus]|uniref:SgcJ/EcaC family oxidoreductase n=1 Tax=Streptomyces atratus TaxID=1893 RepID=UPI0033D74D37
MRGPASRAQEFTKPCRGFWSCPSGRRGRRPHTRAVESASPRPPTVARLVYSDGREAIRARMAAGFAGPLKGSTVVDEVRSVRFIGEDAAVVISRSGILPAGGSAVPAEHLVLATRVLAKAAGEDRLVAGYHNCPVGTV